MTPRPRVVHTVRFYAPSAIPAQCLAFLEESRLLALSRGNNDIEIWNFTAAPFMQKWIPGTSESSVEGLAWAKGRLFSTGLHGLVLEHDLNTLSTKQQFAVTSGPSWCISYNENCNKLAVGTEEGYICLFEVTDEGLSYDRVMDKQEGRVLCLAWHTSGNYLATGSPDAVRLWDVNSRHPVSRMTTGRSEKHKDTIVWSVALANDFTIISGDSRGKTCFWNGKLGTLIDAYQTHKADVLTVSLNPSQDVAYSSGIDPLIMHFQPVTKKNGKIKWVTSIHRWVHTHDVRAIISLQKTIISVGVDSVLAVNDVASKSVLRYPPVPHGNCVAVAHKSQMILLRYLKHIEVWKMGKIASETCSSSPTETVGSVMSLESEPVKVLSLKTKDDESVRASAISDDGIFLGYVTATRMRIYKLTTNVEGKTPIIERLSVKSGQELQVAHHLKFFISARNNHWKLTTATENGDLQLFDIDTDNSVNLSSTITRKSLRLETSISHLSLEFGTELCAVADFKGNVSCVDMKSRSLISQMPVYNQAPISALRINPYREKLVIVYTDNRMVECHLKTGKYTSSGGNIKLPKSLSNKKFPTKGLVLEKDKNIVLLFDDNQLCSIDREFSVNQGKEHKQQKRRSLGELDESNDIQLANVFTVKKYEHLVHFDQFEDQSLLAVEVKPEIFEEQLPPSLRQKKFGIM